MSNVPAELKYSKEHEWLRKEAMALQSLVLLNTLRSCWAIWFLLIQPVGATVSAGDDAVAESVKAVASDLCAGKRRDRGGKRCAERLPGAGEQRTVCRWLDLKIKASDKSELESLLLDATAHEALLEDEYASRMALMLIRPTHCNANYFAYLLRRVGPEKRQRHRAIGVRDNHDHCTFQEPRPHDTDR